MSLVFLRLVMSEYIIDIWNCIISSNLFFQAQMKIHFETKVIEGGIIAPIAKIEGEQISHLDNEEFSITSVGDRAVVFILKVSQCNHIKPVLQFNLLELS